MLKRGLIFVIVAGVLSGCSTFTGDNAILRNHDNDYLQSANLAPLKAPPGIHLDRQDPYYALPYQDVGPVKNISLVPPGSYAEQQAIAKSQGVKNAKR